MLIATYGSRGEFQPFLALARAAMRDGHDVVLSAQANPGFAELAAAESVPFVAAGASWNPEEVTDIQSRAEDVTDVVGAMKVVVEELMLPSVKEMFEAYCELAADADVIVAHFGHPAGRMAADALGKPYVSVMLEPSGLPTRHYPPPGGRRPPRWLRAVMRGPLRAPIGRAINAQLWRENNHKVEAAFGYAINRAREEAGLPQLHNLAADSLYSRDLNLIAVSRHVAPPAPDWGQRHRVTGWWFLEQGDYSRPPEVAAFLADGPTPIAISLGGVPGTLPSADGVALSRVLLDAVRVAGVRAIVEPGGLDLAMGDLPEGVLRYSVPHAWLFPRASAVLHHAGAGTTAATLKAGIPSVTLPDLWDQPYWAGKLHTLGCAPPPVWRGSATAAELAAAIRAATASPQIRQRVAYMSQLIRSEGGTAEALRLIEDYVDATPTPSNGREALTEERAAVR